MESLLRPTRCYPRIRFSSIRRQRGSRMRGEYGYGSFSTDDLRRLARTLDDMDKKGIIFLLSYADCSEIQEIARKWFSKRLLVRRHVAGFSKHRSNVREVLISNAA